MANKHHGRARSANVQNTAAAGRKTWPLLLVGLATLIIIIGVALLWSRSSRAPTAGTSVEVTGQPKLVLDRQVIDFGKVQVDQPVKAVFTLTNAGDKPLQILNEPVVEVREGC